MCVCVCLSPSLSLGPQGWALASLCISSAHAGLAGNSFNFLYLLVSLPWLSVLVGQVLRLLLFESMWSDMLSALSDC